MLIRCWCRPMRAFCRTVIQNRKARIHRLVPERVTVSGLEPAPVWDLAKVMALAQAAAETSAEATSIPVVAAPVVAGAAPITTGYLLVKTFRRKILSRTNRNPAIRKTLARIRSQEPWYCGQCSPHRDR